MYVVERGRRSHFLPIMLLQVNGMADLLQPSHAVLMGDTPPLLSLPTFTHTLESFYTLLDTPSLVFISRLSAAYPCPLSFFHLILRLSHVPFLLLCSSYLFMPGVCQTLVLYVQRRSRTYALYPSPMSMYVTKPPVVLTIKKSNDL